MRAKKKAHLAARHTFDLDLSTRTAEKKENRSFRAVFLLCLVKRINPLLSSLRSTRCSKLPFLR